MEEYREKLKLTNAINGVACLILAVFCVLGFAGEAGWVSFMTPAAGDSHWQSTWRGFVSGAAGGILALMLYGFIRNALALKDEKKLKKLYIKEKDERQNQIYTQALCAAMRTALILGLVAVVVTGYFNMTVSITLLVTVFVVSWMCLGFKLYFSRKF